MHTTDHLHDHDHDHDHPQENLQGWLKTLILLALGLYFVYNIASGNLANYINQRFTWLSVVAVVLFFTLGLFSAVEQLRRRGADPLHHHHHDHDHTHITWPTLLVVAVPLVLGTLVPSRPLGSAAIDGSISLTAATGANVATLQTNPLEWNVLDWLRAFSSADDMTSFNGQQADVVGFLYREASFPPDQFMIARFTISCCVADAAAIGLPVIWAGSDEIAQDTWLRVQGTFTVGEFRGSTVPLLRATQVETVPQPDHPYLYP